MLVLIDESGCPGFKFTRGSEAVFALGMVIFETSEAARETEAVIKKLHAQLTHKPEFKFSKCSDDVRDGFFRGVASCPFTVRAMIVKKEVIHSAHLRSSPDSFYNYFLKQLVRFDSGALNNALVRIDGSGSRKFQRALSQYLRRDLGEKIKNVKMSDSERDPLMQLADMCVGAIARAERDRDNPTRWKDMLAPHISNIWPFG